MIDFLTILKLLVEFRTEKRYLTLGQCVLVWVALLASGNSLSITSQETQTPLLKELQAECNPQGIQVKLWFKEPFTGVAYSHGHYESTKCRYICHGDEDADGGVSEKPQNKATEASGTNFSFLIPMNECGTIYYEGAPSGKQQKDDRSNKSNEYEVYFENTILIQNDPTITEAGDMAKTLRCVWQKQIRQPLMASLPIGNGKMSSSKLYGGNPQRVKTITATMNKNRPIRPIPEENGSLILSSNSNISQASAARLNIRFQKKGQVQSVPFNERRQHSRAMHMDHDEDEASLENHAKAFMHSKPDLVSALPLQRKYDVPSLAHKNNQIFSLVCFVTLLIFSIPTRI